MRTNPTPNIVPHLLSLRRILQARIDAIDNLLEILSQESTNEPASPNRQTSTRRQQREEAKARAKAWAAQQHK